MEQDLQYLIDRIRKEGLEDAEQQAQTILARAREDAESRVQEAEQEAAQLLKKAEQDAGVFTERSITAIAQAARDLIITVGRGVEQVVAGLIDDAVSEALNPQVLEQMLLQMVGAYVAGDGRESDATVLLGPEDRERLRQFFDSRLKDALARGLKIEADGHLRSGFVISLEERHVRHDFSQQAIAESLAASQRPRLAEIVLRVALEQTGAARG